MQKLPNQKSSFDLMLDQLNQRSSLITFTRKQDHLTYDFQYFLAGENDATIPELLIIKVITPRQAKSYYLQGHCLFSLETLVKSVQSSSKNQNLSHKLLSYDHKTTTILIYEKYEYLPKFSQQHTFKLDKCDQMALLGLFTIEFILNKSEQSIGSEKTFIQLLLEHIHVHIGLFVAKQQIKQVLKYFKFSEEQLCQNMLNSQIYSQDRFVSGCTRSQLIYFPTHVTTIMFQMIVPHYFSKFLSGQSGISKSISFCLYTQIFNQLLEPFLFKEDFTMMKQFFPLKRFKKLPKVIYFTITEEGFTVENAIKVFKAQINCKIEQTQLSQVFLQIREQYRQRGIECRVVVDQINIFTSMRRKIYCEKELSPEQASRLYKEYSAIKSFLRPLALIFYVIIYNSSMNIEREAPIGQKQLGFFESLPEFNVNYWSSINRVYHYIEKLRIMQFQLNKLAIIIGKTQLIEEIRLLFKKLTGCNQRISSSMFTICGQITHLNMSTHFSKNISYYLASLTAQELSKSDFVEDTLLKIHLQSLKREAKHYTAFLMKDSSEKDIMEKYLLLERLQQKASRLVKYSEQEKEQHSFQLPMMSNCNPSNINRQKMELKGETITVFTSPQSFLAISPMISRKTTIFEEVLKQFHHQKISGFQFGMFADRFYSSCIARQKIHLFLLGRQYYLNGQGCYFEHFHRMEDHFIFEEKFCNVLQALSNSKEDYVGAYPVLKRGKNIVIPQPVKSSFNSWCLDGLIMGKNKHEENSYEIITLDFSVGYNREYIKKKLKKCIQFFKAIKKSLFSRGANLALDIHHIVFAPKQVVEFLLQKDFKPFQIVQKGTKRVGEEVVIPFENSSDTSNVSLFFDDDEEETRVPQPPSNFIHNKEYEIDIRAKVSLSPIEDLSIQFENASTISSLRYKYIRNWLQKNRSQ